MHVDDLILGNLAIPSVFQHVQRRLIDAWGLSSNHASDIDRLVKAYCLINEPSSVLDDLIDTRQTLQKIAEQLGVPLSPDVQRATLISAIVERGLGFRRLSLAGTSNDRARIEGYHRRFLSPQRTGKRRSPEELREAGISCASIIEQTLKDIFAFHTKILFRRLAQEQRDRIRGVAKGGYAFKTVVDKIRNLDQKVLAENDDLKEALMERTGRSWVLRDATLAVAEEMHTLRSVHLAHERKSASWSEIEPVVRPIIEKGLQFMNNVVEDHVLPRMVLQIRSVTDEWGRNLVMCLTEDDFDEDGNPNSASERFDENMGIRADECLVLDGRRIPFRPRIPCYCLPDDFSLPLTDEIELFFSDELRHFPSELELGYE